MGPLLAHPGSLVSVVSRTVGRPILAEEVDVEEAPSFFVVMAVEEPGVWEAVTWWISLLRTQIRESVSCGKTQAYPRLLVNTGSGPFHCLERRSFNFTSGFAFCCSEHRWWSIAVVPDKPTLKLFITKRACCKIWWGELYLNSPSFNFWICIFNVWCALSTIACPWGL